MYVYGCLYADTYVAINTESKWSQTTIEARAIWSTGVFCSRSLHRIHATAMQNCWQRECSAAQWPSSHLSNTDARERGKRASDGNFRLPLRKNNNGQHFVERVSEGEDTAKLELCVVPLLHSGKSSASVILRPHYSTRVMDWGRIIARLMQKWPVISAPLQWQP